MLARNIKVEGVEFVDEVDGIKTFRNGRRKAGLDEDDVCIVEDGTSVLMFAFSVEGAAFIEATVAALERYDRKGDGN